MEASKRRDLKAQKLFSDIWKAQATFRLTWNPTACCRKTRILKSFLQQRFESSELLSENLDSENNWTLKENVWSAKSSIHKDKVYDSL